MASQVSLTPSPAWGEWVACAPSVSAPELSNLIYRSLPELCPGAGPCRAPPRLIRGISSVLT